MFFFKDENLLKELKLLQKKKIKVISEVHRITTFLNLCFHKICHQFSNYLSMNVSEISGDIAYQVLVHTYIRNTCSYKILLQGVTTHRV